MTKLHKSADQNSAQDTTIAYQVGYYSWNVIGEKAKQAIVWNKSHVFTKWQLLFALSDDKEKIFLPGDCNAFSLRWEFNNVPTEQQWNGLADDALIRVQFRISGLAGGTGRIALLSLLGLKKSELVKESVGE